MPVTQFNDPVLRSDGSLDVSGPFILDSGERDRILGDVVIRFLVVQDHDPSQPAGAAEAAVEATATWTDSDGDEWRHVVPASKVSGFEVGATVRGIGLAVLLKKPPSFSPTEPPLFETITWCVSKKVVAG
jgi:hypothetical protein